MGRATALLVRTDLRRRWVVVVFAGLLIGLAGGIVLLSATGARRASSAFDRMMERHAVWDATVEVHLTASDEALAALTASPAVRHVAAATMMPMGENGERLGVIAGLDDGWLHTVYRPHVLEGRLPDADSLDQISVSRAARDAGLDIGDRVILRDWLEAVEPAPVTVVGVHEGPFDLLPPDEGPNTLVSTAFGRHFGEPLLEALLATDDANQVRIFLAVRLHDGADPTALGAVVASLPAQAAPVVRTRAEWFGHIDDRGDTAVTAFWLMFALTSASTVLLVATATARLVGSSTFDDGSLRAIALGRRQRTLVRGAAPGVCALVATLVALCTAVALSPHAVVGPTRAVDPDDGIWLDARVVALGAVALFALVAGLGALWASRTTDSVVSARVLPGGRLPVVVRVGTDLAWSRGGRRRIATTVIAASAVAIGVALTSAVIVYLSGEQRLVEDPRRYGNDFDVVVFPNTTGYLPPWGMELDRPGLLAVTISSFAVVDLDGQNQYALALQPVHGDIGITVMDGRAPLNATEVLVGVDVARDRGLHVGDSVTVSDSLAAPFVVVGIGILPNIEQIPYGGGVLLAGDALRRVGSEPLAQVLLAKIGPDVTLGGYPVDPTVPNPVNDLDALSGLAILLAVVGGVLAIAVAVFVLAGIGRSRSHDLATVHAMGATLGQLRASILVAALTVIVPAATVGLVTGVVVGARFWSRVAEDLPVVDDVHVPAAPLVLLALGALAASVLVAAWPAATLRRHLHGALRRE